MLAAALIGLLVSDAHASPAASPHAVEAFIEAVN
jgi:hypothetical protein